MPDRKFWSHAIFDILVEKKPFFLKISMKNAPHISLNHMIAFSFIYMEGPFFTTEKNRKRNIKKCFQLKHCK